MKVQPFLVHMETTTTRLSVAKKMIRTILREELAANAWLSKIQSYYIEDGRMRVRTEHFVAFKTSEEGRVPLRERIGDLHDEEKPYLGWLKLHEMPERYAEWVRAQSGPTKGRRKKRR